MASLGSRVKRLLRDKGMSQAELARLVGTKQQTISYICSEGHEATTSRYSHRIAEVLGVNPTWLNTGKGDPHDPTVRVEIQGVEIRAIQIPVLPHEQIFPYLRGKNYLKKGVLMIDKPPIERVFAIDIEGDSMTPRFKHGDRVVIDTGIQPEPGDFVCALLKSGHITFRRYRARQQTFDLSPENQDWDVIEAGEVQQIVGVMTEHRIYRRNH